MALTIDLAQPTAHTLTLRLASGELSMKATLTAQDLALCLDGSQGEVRGSQVSVEDFEIITGELTAKALSISGRNVTVGWGDTGFRFEADALDGPSLSLSLGGLGLEVGDYSVQGLSVHDSEVALARCSLASVAVRKRFEALPRSGPKASTPKAEQPIFDWHLLDGLRGDLNVDLGVDLTVPVIGRRRATHRFRIRIDDGAVDYRALEKDLSTLENAFLDFAVRSDGTLVLERGIPLLPTRGRGKPILTWHLDPEDLKLAQQNRVRLAVLPHFEVASSDEPRPSDSPSPITLRSLNLGNLESRLRLVPGELPSEAVLRRLAVGGFTLRGELQHQPDQEPPSGSLRGAVQDLALELAALPLGSSELSVRSLALGAVPDVQASFAGLVPRSLTCQLSSVTIEGLALTERSA